jgi:ATPase subunit of ABC transporter with duplicated ATPase domains
MGEQETDSGEFSVGETVKNCLCRSITLILTQINQSGKIFGQELIMMGGKQVNSRAYLSVLTLVEENKTKKYLRFGGERNRLHLAMTLKEEGNVLLLDEPTNDLDVNTLRALEEGLEILQVVLWLFHDRWFLDRICTHILAFEGDQVYYSRVVSLNEENKEKRLGGDLTLSV